jgi:hypothetical protein
LRTHSRPKAILPGLLVLVLGLAAAACSSIGGSSGGTGGTTFSGIFGSSSAPASTTASTNPDDEATCPIVDVRQGASTITIHGQGDQVATNVRFQATIGELARECAFAGASMTMKVGVQGRIIVGPLGGEGQFDVPLRLALVQEGPNPKTIWTKLYRLPVAVPQGQTNVPFLHVEQDLTVPKPSPADLENYIVYAGFDQQALTERPQRRSPARRAR